MPDETKTPDGLKVGRTASGGWRFEMPKHKMHLLHFLVAAPPLFIMARRRFASGEPRSFSVFDMFMAVCLVLIAWWWYWLLAGRRAIEVDSRGITRCFRVPIFPERRSFFPIEDIGALTVTTFKEAKGHSQYWIEMEFKGKRKMLASDLDRSGLEWLSNRLAVIMARYRSGDDHA